MEMSNQSPTQAPEEGTPTNNWGRWGADDERGALNLLTPDVVAEAARVPHTGKVYSLGLPIQRSGIPNFDYRGIPQRLTLVNHADEQMSHSMGGPPGVGSNEDMFVMAAHTATHLDALGHCYADYRLYNGFPHDEVTPYTGAPRCSIDKVGAIVGRGVLLDVASAMGVDQLDPGYVVTPADLEQTLEAQGSSLRQGDLVLIRTGWLDAFMRDPETPLHPQPGLGMDAADFLVRYDPAVVGADNGAVETMPFDQDVFMGVHLILLVRNGIHLVENVVLGELAADRCHEFLLTIAPLRVTGATGCPVTPVALG
jgi:kynurenine formamidase